MKLLCFHDVSVVVMFFCFFPIVHSSLTCLQVENRREETIWLPSSELRPFFWCLKAINKLAIKKHWGVVVNVKFIGGIKVWTWPPLWAAGCDELTRYSSLCFGRWLCGEFLHVSRAIFWYELWHERSRFFFGTWVCRCPKCWETPRFCSKKMSWNHRNLRPKNWSNVFVQIILPCCGSILSENIPSSGREHIKKNPPPFPENTKTRECEKKTKRKKMNINTWKSLGIEIMMFKFQNLSFPCQDPFGSVVFWYAKKSFTNFSTTELSWAFGKEHNWSPLGKTSYRKKKEKKGFGTMACQCWDSRSSLSIQSEVWRIFVLGAL